MDNKLSSLALVVAVAAFVLSLAGHGKHADAPVAETGYDRVVRSNTLRCGYGTWQPGVYRDLQTGEMKGLFAELTEAMGKLNGIKIEWTAETDWGQIPEAIDSGKIDAFCAGMADDAMRGKRLAYTDPLSFWTFDVLVRADDTRFPAGETVRLSDLDKSDYAAAYSEGDVLETIVKNEFPNVKGVALSPLATPADNLMDVTTRKTDFVIMPKVMFQLYDKANPGQLRYLKVEPSLRTYGNVIAVGIDDLKLQQLLNASIHELVKSGAYDRIMTQYDLDYPGAFLRVALGYAPAKEGM